MIQEPSEIRACYRIPIAPAFPLERKQIVATKAICQIISHGAKFIYFGALIDQSAAPDPVMAGAAINAINDRDIVSRADFGTPDRYAI